MPPSSPRTPETATPRTAQRKNGHGGAPPVELELSKEPTVAKLPGRKGVVWIRQETRELEVVRRSSLRAAARATSRSRC